MRWSRIFKWVATSSRTLGALCCFGASAHAYTNPITVPNEYPIDGVGDPFVLKYDGTFYLYSSRVQAPGFQYWTSTDCVNWSYGGLDCTDPVINDGYAPEVVYWNGTFYMYTSPGGGGHYVLTSSSPGGPFVRATGNLGHSIDGDVFIDDDGSWFFFNAGADGIHGSPMSSPTSLGAEAILPGSQLSGQWSEGPTVFKRNGTYYLTDTGNHVLSKGYRVNVASSSVGPLGPYTPSNLNPMLLSSEGAHVGLGHNSVFIGPDLDTYYAVYHSLASVIDGHPARKLNVDAIGWNGDKLTPYGPTSWAMRAPDAPNFEDRFQRASIGTGYSNTAGGSWSVSNGFLSQSTKGSTAFFIERETSFQTASDYTAEFNVRELSRGTLTPKCGAVFGFTDPQNYGYAVLNGVTNQLQTNSFVAGQWGTEVSSALPAGFDNTQLHTIRLEKLGTTYKFFVDKRLLQTKSNAALGGGNLGYLSQDDAANFGYIAASNQVGGTGIFDFYKPIPGTIQAVHYNSGGEGVGYHDTTPGNNGGKYIRGDDVDIRDSTEGGEAISGNESGEWYKYNVNVAEAGSYNLGIRYATTAGTPQLRVWLDGANVTGVVTLPGTSGANDWQTYDIKGLNLAAGEHTLKVETVTGEFDLYTLAFAEADNSAIDRGDTFDSAFSTDWGFVGGTWSIVNGAANINATGKRTLGNAGWTDYTVECDISGQTALNSGIIVRVQNPAQGGAGDDPNLGTDFYQGYFAGISSTQVVLGKQNYDWTPLASAPGSYALKTWHHMKVEVSANNLKVYVDDMNAPKLDYTDQANPFLNGKVGLRAHQANSSFDNFKVTHTVPAPPVTEIDGGLITADASVPDASVPDASVPDASVPDASVDASIPDASVPDASVGGHDAGSTVLDAGTPGKPPSTGNSSSCACRSAGRAPAENRSWRWAVLGVAAFAARRRRRGQNKR